MQKQLRSLVINTNSLKHNRIKAESHDTQGQNLTKQTQGSIHSNSNTQRYGDQSGHPSVRSTAFWQKRPSLKQPKGEQIGSKLTSVNKLTSAANLFSPVSKQAPLNQKLDLISQQLLQKPKKIVGSQSERSLQHISQLRSSRLVTQVDKDPLSPKTNPNAQFNKLIQVFSKGHPHQVQTQISKIDTEHVLDPQTILKSFPDKLTQYEKKEILEFKNIYCFGQDATKINATLDKDELNYGYDNDRGDYLYVLNDHIAYRYEVLERIGKGSFGQTFKVMDHKRKTLAALKMIRNKKKFHSQALIEIQILKTLREVDQNGSHPLVRIKDYLLFRNHVCILFELLSINLYEFLKLNRFSGISQDLIRRFAIQLLQGLLILESKRIIHCDLKPENILLKEPQKSGIKIIDFGSSCFEDEKLYSYIQSRFYRAPEILLGLPYGQPIDMWSFGCIVVELCVGMPIFASESEKDHMSMILEVIGLPPKHMIDQSPKKFTYFDDSLTAKTFINSRGKTRIVGGCSLAQILGPVPSNFLDFVEQCLTWDPIIRIKAAEALVHEWILEGLPEQLREQHLNQMRQQAPWLKCFKTTKQQEAIISPLQSSRSNNKQEGETHRNDTGQPKFKVSIQQRRRI